MAGGPRIGDEFEADVRDLTSAGLGVVAHPSGRVFFARGVWPGERGTFAITALKGRAGEAALIELLERSPARATPACVHHGVTADACGGCPWQFVSYDAQLVAKQQRIEKHLAPLLAPGSVAPIWPSPEELGYRNRAQLKSDGQRLGYLAAASRNIVDVDDCPILNEHNRGTLRALRAELPKRAWRPRRGRDWTTIDIDDDVDAQGAGVNRRRPFRQGNSAQNERMRQWLADTVSSLGAVGQVLELYAGSGNFTDVLAAAGCAPITAVDSFAPAVDALSARSLPGVTTVCSDLHRADALAAMEPVLREARLLVLDPPREGLRQTDQLLERAPALQAIVYISCDVATFARDAALAQERGFALQSVQPLDLFPQTPHVELLGLLRRRT